jgi:hypothetical protein
MRTAKIVFALTLALTLISSAKSALAVCEADSTSAACVAAKNKANLILCGRYSLSFSADVLPVGHIAGTGAITSDCQGNLIKGVETINDDGQICEGKLAGTYSLNQNGTGTVKFSLIPYEISVLCPVVNFSEAIAVGQNGQIVKAINTDNDEVTIQEEWVHQ